MERYAHIEKYSPQSGVLRSVCYMYIIFLKFYIFSTFLKVLFLYYMWGGVFCPMSVLKTGNVIRAGHQYYNHWHFKYVHLARVGQGP